MRELVLTNRPSSVCLHNVFLWILKKIPNLDMHFFLQYFTEFWKWENIYMQTNQIVRGVDKTTCHRILIFMSPITNRHLFGGNILCWSFNICSTHMKFQNNIFYSWYTEDLIIHNFSQNCTHFCTKWHTSASMEGEHEKKCFYLTIMHRQGNLCLHSHSSQPFSPIWNVHCNAAPSN